MPHPTSRPSRGRRTRRAAAAGTVAAVTLGTLAATTAPLPASAAPVARSTAASPLTTGDLDVRAASSPTAQKAADARVAAVEASSAVSALRASLGSQALLDIDSTTLTPRNVARLDGFLTAPSSAAAADVALGFVRAHADVFRLTSADLAGLRLGRDYVDVDGTHHLSWVQTAGGTTLFGNGLKASVTKDGRLVNVQGSPVAGLAAPSAPTRLSADAAITVAKKALRAAKTAPLPGDTAAKVLFAVGGQTRPAYQVVNMTVARPALTVVDAESGRVLYRQSLTDDANADETADVYENFPGAGKGGTPHGVDLTAKGWLPGGAVVLYGNNAHTYTDVNDDNASDPSEEVAPNQRGSYDFTLRPQDPSSVPPCADTICTWRPGVAQSWLANRKQTAVQNFYYINKYHDHLAAAPIGFTEAAGNFQQVNSSGQGQGGDPVQDEPLDGASVAGGLPDGAHIDNANMSTPPDGTAPRMQMYLFHQPGASYPDQDPFLAVSGSDEADVVYHEYTHGLSNRLVVDANGVSGLTAQQSGSMGEAWSDWYAMDYLVDQGLITDTSANGQVLVGDYVSNGQRLIRTEAIDCAVGAPASACPGAGTAGSGGYTYGDFGRISSRGAEVHADGEIWGQTLWDLRTALGSATSESLVTRAMELSPVAPSYLDMRNAILQADQVTRGGADTATIWKTFAHRGMGFFAGAVGGADTSPVEDFSLPPAPGTPRATVTGQVTDSVSGKGVQGATVAFGGHDSGFPGSYATTTGPDGAYVIAGVFPGTYPDVYAGGAGYNAQVKTVSVRSGTTSASFSIVRDWAAASGGARISATNGNEYASFGCGTAGLIDQSLGLGWSADLPASGGKYATISLPAAVDIDSLQIDPTGTCGDDISASTGKYTVETSTDGTTFVQAASGTFTPAQIRGLQPVPLKAGTGTAVKAVRFTMLSSQASFYQGTCPGTGYSGCFFIDSTELEVFGSQH